MSIKLDDSLLHSALAGVPGKYRRRLIDSYLNLRSAFADGAFDACGLRGARFAEVVLRFLQETLTGTAIPFGQRINNFADECNKLEKLPATAGRESLRVIMPRGLLFLYILRNKRGIGHVGGDVEANKIDASTIQRIADWCVAELIRIYHSLSIEEAQDLVDAISIRELPRVWQIAGKRRVLDPGLEFKAQTMLLLYFDRSTAIPSEDLCGWVEYSSLSDFRRFVLRPMHKDRLIEYDTETETVILSPSGAQKVEREILPKVRAEPVGTSPRRKVRRST